MLKKILIGLDGSPYSDAAVDLGIRWARELGASITGLGIIDQPTIERGEPVPIGGTAFKERRDRRRLEEARQKVEAFLARFAARCRDEGVAWESHEDVGLPADEIHLEAESHDLVLLGKQTEFHFETHDRDDTLRRVLKSCPRPVVTVPEKLRAGSSVVVAYDGTAQAARALQLFQTLGVHGSLPVHVVTVLADAEDAAHRAGRATSFLRTHGIDASAVVVVAKAKPGERILEKANELDAGLVVLGAHGQPALREFFIGSVTKTVLGKAEIPLFLYH